MNARLKIGSRLDETFEVSSAEEGMREGSRRYAKLRSDSGEGASTFPTGQLWVGKTRYHVSYNGRIWDKTAATLVAEAFGREAS